MIGINKFVLRQVPESKYSHFAGSFEELAKLAEAHFAEAKSGYRDGVVLVPVPAERFFSGVVEVTPDTPLRATFAARRKGEGPEPLTPMAMARNFLELPGGTKATYSAEEFAHAIIYWSKRAMRG